MLSYPIDEAEELLTSRLATAKQNMLNCEEDLDFLREQITVSASQAESSEAGVPLPGSETDNELDNGSSNGKSLQLGCYDEAERKGRARCI